jgi:hypothetical protein
MSFLGRLAAAFPKAAEFFPNLTAAQSAASARTPPLSAGNGSGAIPALANQFAPQSAPSGDRPQVTAVQTEDVKKAIQSGTPNLSIDPNRVWDKEKQKWRPARPEERTDRHSLSLTDAKGNPTLLGISLANAKPGTAFIIERGATFDEFRRLLDSLPPERQAGALAWVKRHQVFDEYERARETRVATAATMKTVAQMTSEEKLSEAVGRALDRLPAETAAKLRELLTPENLAVMTAFATAWAAGHATGVSEIADAIAILGLMSLGAEGIEAGKDLYQFVSLALNAQSEGELDAAGAHLAKAAAIIGVDGTLAILTHKGGKSLESKGPQGPLFKPEFVTPNGAPLPTATALPQSVPMPKPPITTLPHVPNSNSGDDALTVGGATGGEPASKAAEARKNDWRDLFGDGPETKAMREVTAREAGMANKPKHHVFPQEHRAWFEERGFVGERDIDNFTVQLDEATHQAIHGGGNWKLARKEWDGEWNKIVMRELMGEERRLGRKLTFDEAKTRVEKIMARYAISTNYVKYKE